MREIRLFGHYLNFPLVILSAFDMAVAFGAVLLVAATDSRTARPIALLTFALIAGITLFVTKAAVGLYHIQSRMDARGVLTRTAVAFLLGLPVVTVAAAVTSVTWDTHGNALFAAVLAFGALGVIHVIFFSLADAGALRRRVLVLGAGPRAAGLSRLRRRADRRGFQVVGFIPMGETEITASPVATLNRPLCRYARDLGIHEIVVALEERRGLLPIDELAECRFWGITVVDLSTFVEREAGKVRIDLLRPGWLVFEGNRVGRLQDLIKRVMDVTVSFGLLLITLPLTLATAVAIKREEGWRAPVLYKQVRVGRNGAHFQLMKFRSMHVDAEADGQPRWASRDDARVTRVGRLMRKTRIDELPQLFNVLRGEMSLVGPRPERPAFVAELERHIPYYADRHRIKPGVTGWAQLLYPYGSSHADAAEKLQYDLYYLKNRSLMLDVIVLLQTVEVVLFGKGAR